MYYRWTKRARPFISSYDGEVVGKWKRISCNALLKKYPQYRQWVRQGDMEIKDESSTAKQIAQRKMWQLQGRILALQSQEIQLAKELREHFPYHFKNLGISSVIQEFHSDVTNIDMGLLLKKYYPHLYNSTTPP